MPRILLTPEECGRLRVHTKNLIDYINNIHDLNPNVTDSIKNIQVPMRLSESMALNQLRNGAILILNANNHALFNAGRRRGDYDIEYDRNNQANRIKIEIKATGTNTFQRFRSHAMTSDVTIWIDFYGLRIQPTTLDYRIYVFRTIIVFHNFLHLKEKEMSLHSLMGNNGITVYEGQVI